MYSNETSRVTSKCHNPKNDGSTQQEAFISCWQTAQLPHRTVGNEDCNLAQITLQTSCFLIDFLLNISREVIFVVSCAFSAIGCCPCYWGWREMGLLKVSGRKKATVWMHWKEIGELKSDEDSPDQYLLATAGKVYFFIYILRHSRKERSQFGFLFVIVIFLIQ